MASKKEWNGFAMGVEPLDDGEPNGQRAVLEVWLTTGDTPTQHVGRTVQVVLTKPMLEALARMAQETDSVYYVEVINPRDLLWGNASEEG